MGWGGRGWCRGTYGIVGAWFQVEVSENVKLTHDDRGWWLMVELNSSAVLKVNAVIELMST